MDCLSNVSNSVWFVFVLFVIHGGNAALLQTCADDAACKATGGDPNAICLKDTTAGGDANGKCICTGSFKETNGVCVAKVLGSTCAAASDCTAHVQNSDCSDSKKCSCATNYIQDGNDCAKELGQACSLAGECVTNAECDKICKCSDEYVDTNGLCVTPSSAITTRLAVSVAVISILSIIVQNTF